MFDVRARITRALTSVAIAAGVLVVLGAVGGLIVMISGAVPIKASARHWDITAAFLDFAKRRSVKTHTFRMKVPPLEDPALALKGAGHYDFACEPCHGSPSVQQPRIAYRMTPPPPDLREQVSTYYPEELFYIVKHGIKFTGMPAWPTQQRDDEVWAMVALLEALPSLGDTGYERAANPPDSKKFLARRCPGRTWASNLVIPRPRRMRRASSRISSPMATSSASWST